MFIALLGTCIFLILFVSSVLKDDVRRQQVATDHAQPYWKNKHSKLQLTANTALIKLDNLTDITNSNDFPKECEATILLIRHCEDLGGGTRYKDDTKHCSYLGFERSIYLASLFGNSTANARWPLPSRLYGIRKGGNVRQYETLQPLSEKANVTITEFSFDSAIHQLSSSILTGIASGDLCHQVVIIAWKHDFIKDLAASLGCGQANQGCPDSWDDYDFDSVWQLKYVYQPKQFRQELDKRIEEGQVDTEWMIYGTRSTQGFDPLAFSKAKYDPYSDLNIIGYGGH
jgi:hypothetical protein